MHWFLINIQINNWSTYINIWSIQRSISNQHIWYSWVNYFILQSQNLFLFVETAERDVKQSKPTDWNNKIWIKFPFKRMKLQSNNLKQLSRSNFHNNFCQICKLNEEDWNKYNTIYLTTIKQLIWSKNATSTIDILTIFDTIGT